jgi:hypothetical protein
MRAADAAFQPLFVVCRNGSISVAAWIHASTQGLLKKMGQPILWVHLRQQFERKINKTYFGVRQWHSLFLWNAPFTAGFASKPCLSRRQARQRLSLVPLGTCEQPPATGANRPRGVRQVMISLFVNPTQFNDAELRLASAPPE